MDAFRNYQSGMQPASGVSPCLDADLDAAISCAFRNVLYALPRKAVEAGWTPDRLAGIHKSLKEKEKSLFGTDNFLTKKGNPIRWDPTDIITWGRLFGFKEQVQKHVRVRYNKRWRIQKAHIRRLQLILNELGVGLDKNQTWSVDDRSTWVSYLNYLGEEIGFRALAPGILTSERTDNEAEVGVSERSRAPERLSEKLAKLNDVQGVVSLLADVDHRYEWSIRFREALSLLELNKRDEVARLFYKTVGCMWLTPGDKPRHVAIMSAGTLTYVAGHIDGLREVGTWNDWLETVIDDLSPEMVLVAEPLSVIASIHGKHGAFLKNINRFIDANPSYRQLDFAERLLYCSGEGGALTLDEKVINVAKNISLHLNEWQRAPQILCHDVGRVIEAYPRLIRRHQYLDLAQFIKDATLESLANIDLKPSLRARVEDLMEATAGLG